MNPPSCITLPCLISEIYTLKSSREIKKYCAYGLTNRSKDCRVFVKKRIQIFIQPTTVNSAAFVEVMCPFLNQIFLICITLYNLFNIICNPLLYCCQMLDTSLSRLFLGVRNNGYIGFLFKFVLLFKNNLYIVP